MFLLLRPVCHILTLNPLIDMQSMRKIGMTSSREYDPVCRFYLRFFKWFDPLGNPNDKKRNVNVFKWFDPLGKPDVYPRTCTHTQWVAKTNSTGVYSFQIVPVETEG